MEIKFLKLTNYKSKDLKNMGKIKDFQLMCSNIFKVFELKSNVTYVLKLLW
jgi:hypothetical protein